MDGIIIIALIFWALSSFSKSAKKKRAAAPARVPQASVPEAEPPVEVAVARPIRPADVDLPGQTTMPSRWDGRGDMPSMTSSEEEAYIRLMYNDAPVRPSDRAAIRERREKEASDEKRDAIPGLPLHFDANSIVQGVIFSEILTRPADRRKA